MATSTTWWTACAWRAVGNCWRAPATPSTADLLRRAAARLATARVPEPGLEARWLAAAAWVRNPSAPLAELPAEGLERFEALLARRLAGEPLAHVTGEAGFRRLRLASDRRALIPRPETEGLVDLVLQRAPAGRVADIGTGSGAIALALADEGNYRQVVAVDQDPAALALARANARATGQAITLRQGDLLTPLRGEWFDAIVSNPPYLSEAEYAALDPAVRAWEPRAALVSGPEGMDAIRRLLREAPPVLVSAGLLALEVDTTRADRVAAEANALGWQDVTVHNDSYGRARFVTARRGDPT